MEALGDSLRPEAGHADSENVDGDRVYLALSLPHSRARFPRCAERSRTTEVLVDVRHNVSCATDNVAVLQRWFDMDSGWQALLHFDPKQKSYLMSEHWKPSSGTYLQEPRLEIFPRSWVERLLIEVDLLLVQSGCHPQRGGRERVVVQGDV